MHDTDPDNDISEPAQASPEKRLWCAALALLIQDAQRHYTSTEKDVAKKRIYRQADRDVMECGPMLRKVCDFIDVEPKGVQREFRKWELEMVPRAGIEPARP